MTEAPTDRKAYQRAYYLAHKEEALKKAAEWAKENPDKRREIVKRNNDKRRGRHPRVRLSDAERKKRRKQINKLRYSTSERATKVTDGLKDWAKRNPGRYAEIRNLASIKYRLKKYGLTIEQYETMLVAQEYRCAICRSDNVGSRRSGTQGGKRTLVDGWPSTAQPGDFLWYVDHDHKTGKVRSLLCHHCNVAIGMMRDDPSLLLAAAEYLKLRQTP